MKVVLKEPSCMWAVKSLISQLLQVIYGWMYNGMRMMNERIAELILEIREYMSEGMNYGSALGSGQECQYAVFRVSH